MSFQISSWNVKNSAHENLLIDWNNTVSEGNRILQGKYIICLVRLLLLQAFPDV